jgi:uncharacterized membrane protein YheB (UPF0754 family)
MSYWLILIPLTTACAGWLSVSLALRMLFYPAKPLTVAGFTWQGIIPRNKSRYAAQIARGVREKLQASDELPKYLSDPATPTLLH